MKYLYSFVISFLFLNNVYTQNTIAGNISDTEGDAIYYATISLLNQLDSSFVKGTTSAEDGFFEIKNVKPSTYLIRVQMLGYEDLIMQNVTVPSDDITDLYFGLKQSSSYISTIEIVGKKPLLEQRGEKLIVNVENNVTNTAGSILDVLKKVPGLLVINDRLLMPGAGNPTILINGKSTQYMDIESLMKDIPGDNIKSVEIISQPGSDYEASGSGPILNIILKKNSLLGTNGSISIGAAKGDLWDYNTGINLSHYSHDFNISGGLGYAQNAYVDELSIIRNLTNISNEVNGVYDQLNYDGATPKTSRANIRMDWNLSPSHELGIEVKYYNNRNKRTSKNDTYINLALDSLQDYSLHTDNSIDRGWTYGAINPYYKFNIDTMGQSLMVDVNIANFKVRGQNTLATSFTNTEMLSFQRYTQPGDSWIYATKVDYTKPLNKSLELKLGLKYSLADLDNNLISEDKMNNHWVNNSSQSNHYLFDEEIFAGYIKSSFSHKEWNGSAGLRAEKSTSTGESLTIDSTQSRIIAKLFPSFSIGRSISKVLSASVSYSYRIDRPRYTSLNPFLYYLDPFTFESGNPNLKPELTHSSKFSLSYEGQPFFNIEYKDSKDAIVEVTRQEPDNQEASKTDVNFDSRKSFNTSLYFPLDFIPKVGGYGGVILDNTSFNSSFDNGNFDRSRWSTTLFIQAEFKLPFDINAELGGWYNSGGQEGIFVSEYIYGTSIGFSKKVLKNKGKISLGVEDFANRFWHAKVDYQQDLQLVSRWQAPIVNAKFSYKFGNQHLKSKSRRKGSGSTEINRVIEEK